MLLIVNVQCNQSIVEDFKQILSILAFLSAISLDIFEHIAETESFSVTAVEDKVCRLVFRLRIVLVVS